MLVYPKWRQCGWIDHEVVVRRKNEWNVLVVHQTDRIHLKVRINVIVIGVYVYALSCCGF